MARYWPGRLRHLPLRKAIMRRYHHAPFAGRPPALWQFQLDNGDIIAPPFVAKARLMLQLYGNGPAPQQRDEEAR